MNKRIIITGAPGTGKTTIINQLESMGYQCMHEVSREIINEEIKKKGKDLPWENLLNFSKKVFKSRKSQLLKSNQQLTFFDRSIVDVHAYLEVSNISVPESFIRDIKEYRYSSQVFYTPIWDSIYINDNERKESISQATMIQEHLLISYKKFGYSLKEIPKTKIKKRIDFILSNI